MGFPPTAQLYARYKFVPLCEYPAPRFSFGFSNCKPVGNSLRFHGSKLRASIRFY